MCGFLARNRPFKKKKKTTTASSSSSFLLIKFILLEKMVFEIFPVVATDQYGAKDTSPSSLHLSPWPSMIGERQHFSQVHIARLGDLFKERCKIIHTSFD